MKKLSILVLAVLSLLPACQNKKEEVAVLPEKEAKKQLLADSLAADVNSQLQEALRHQFQEDLDKDLLGKEDRRFRYAVCDLDEDGADEYLVALDGPYFRGSGGGTILLLDTDRKPITVFTVSQTPVWVTVEQENGWHDLLIESAGAWHRMSFDGKTYPQNPSVAPKADAPQEDVDYPLLDEHAVVSEF